MGALYRVRQFTLALGSHLSVHDAGEAEEYLHGSQLELFRQMSSMDQRHCLAVARALREAGHTEPSLLRAALLHDAGKALGPVRVWHRVGAVLINALWPRAWHTAEDNDETWLYPFHVHRHHAQLGAQLAREAGCGPEEVWLIAHHEDDAPPAGGDERRNRLLTALLAADRIN
ncbi:MAG TPA: HD domain-containing protein [Chloroflexi bacterium]|nr:HD domain-containing protein [Chloroflexota bacterium]